jgi:hypothetical protein
MPEPPRESRRLFYLSTPLCEESCRTTGVRAAVVEDTAGGRWSRSCRCTMPRSRRGW